MDGRPGRFILLALFLVAAAACAPAAEEEATEGPQIMRAERLLMGTRFDIQIADEARTHLVTGKSSKLGSVVRHDHVAFEEVFDVGFKRVLGHRPVRAG